MAHLWTFLTKKTKTFMSKKTKIFLTKKRITCAEFENSLLSIKENPLKVAQVIFAYYKGKIWVNHTHVVSLQKIGCTSAKSSSELDF